VSLYTFSCHSFRHLVGGNKDCYTCVRGGNARRKLYNWVTRINLKHPQWAWYSLVSLLLTDIYLRLMQAGVISEYTIIPFGG
ncbi:MAG: succinate dehydrogenase, partial [Actinomycetota bacterium]|nr:succinate dehydrogenase [Actinomycetota bacterium]